MPRLAHVPPVLASTSHPPQIGKRQCYTYMVEWSWAVVWLVLNRELTSTLRRRHHNPHPTGGSRYFFASNRWEVRWFGRFSDWISERTKVVKARFALLWEIAVSAILLPLLPDRCQLWFHPSRSLTRRTYFLLHKFMFARAYIQFMFLQPRQNLLNVIEMLLFRLTEN